MTLYSVALGVALSQACYATGENHERAVLRQLLGELNLDGVLIKADALHTQKPFPTAQEAGGRLTPGGEGEPANPGSPDQQPAPGKAKDPFRSNGSRDHPRPRHHLNAAQKASSKHFPEAWIGTSWNVELCATGTHDGKLFCASHLILTSLRTTPEALLQLVRGRWSIEGCHWIRDTQLQEDAHRYRGNGAGAISTLRTAVLNLLRLEGFESIRAGMQAVMHDIKALQRWR